MPESWLDAGVASQKGSACKCMGLAARAVLRDISLNVLMTLATQKEIGLTLSGNIVEAACVDQNNLAQVV